ncbi:MAG TPA: 3-phosphoglycerate dehydrogenase [Nocardioidaceae bacterium]|nr:3-phosphoglycerate dehydrogenase [Nocardioidaceae bacterium]
MKILIADTFPETYRERLVEDGHECAYEPDVTADDLPGRVPGFEGLIVRSTKVHGDTLRATETLRLVIRAGSGTNTIDSATAAERGVYVCNVPGRNAIAVAELAFGLLLALDRRIPDNVDDLRAGRWNKKEYAKARGILGRRVGVVGLGRIGMAFAERAAAFGAEVYALAKRGRDPELAQRAEAIGVRFVDDLPSLARSCDVLSFHLPAATATRGLVDRDLLDAMQPGTIVLNTSRGEIIDEDALIEAMDAKRIRAGLDVYVDEPGQSVGSIDSALARHPNVYGTHHIGASTEQAQQAIAEEVVRMIDAYQRGEVLHCVNLDPEPAT